MPVAGEVGGGTDGGSGGQDGYTFVPSYERGIGLFVTVVAFVVIVAGMLPAILGLYYGSARRHVQFVVSKDGLEVPFKVGRVVVAAEDIAAVQWVSEPPRMGRMAGAAIGEFHMGWYRQSDYGRVYRLTTGTGPYVFVDTAPDAGPRTSRAGTRYVFSPAAAAAFVSLLEDVRAGRGPDAEVIFPPVQGKPINPWPWALISAAIAIPFGIVLPWLLTRGKRGMRYHVGPEGIAVHHLGTKWYRWDDIVDVTVREEPLMGVLRTFGTGLPGYYVGKFTAQSMGNLQVNATRLQPPLVVVKTKRSHLVVTPEDVEDFMGAVQKYRDRVV